MKGRLINLQRPCLQVSCDLPADNRLYLSHFLDVVLVLKLALNPVHGRSILGSQQEIVYTYAYHRDVIFLFSMMNEDAGVRVEHIKAEAFQERHNLLIP